MKFVKTMCLVLLRLLKARRCGDWHRFCGHRSETEAGPSYVSGQREIFDLVNTKRLVPHCRYVSDLC